jgi:hypothetical protein
MSGRTLKVLGNLLVPQGDVRLTVVDDRSELLVTRQVLHKNIHTFDTLDQIDDPLLGGLLI